MGNAALEIRNLNYSIREGEGMRKILNNVSLSIKTSSTIAISGPSGSGKTTLIYAISGILNIDSGNVIVFDHDVYSMKKKNRDRFRLENMAIIWQNYNLMPFLNVLDNICIPLVLRGARIDSGKVKQAGEMLEFIGLKDYGKKSISSLSGGEQQRVAIARAMMAKPKLLLADEPTGNLDRENTQRFIEYLAKAVKYSGVTAVIVTHNDNLCTYCDHMVRLIDGKIG